MIRTRDFLLYVVVFVFVLMGLSYTLATGSKTVAAPKNTIVFNTEETSLRAVSNEAFDRDENLRRLREEIARGDGQISQGPPVFDSVDVPSSTIDDGETTSVNQDALVDSSTREVRYCPVQNDFTSVEARWPATGVRMSLEGATRQLFITETHETTVGSSTVATTSTTLMLSLPLVPPRTLANNCIDSAIVGVTDSGQLITNTDAWRFRGVPSSTLIGYARDGHPIYTTTADEAELDECGGIDTGVGYQYHLRQDELFILACFAALPQVFHN